MPADPAAAESVRTVGVLALQGAFAEHEAAFAALPESTRRRLRVAQVRTVAELEWCDALVIPGGESTTMKIIARSDGMMEGLRRFVHGSAGEGGCREGRPVWGTCAGCILLSDDVVDALPAEDEAPAPKRCKYGGPVGGLGVAACRNFFGRQAESFEAPLVATPGASEVEKAAEEAFSGFPAVFIRAPAILRADPSARVLAHVHHPAAQGGKGVAVAVEAGRVLATCFHPELSQDTRIHGYFAERFVLVDRGAGTAA